jgi:hypothetical protein
LQAAAVLTVILLHPTPRQSLVRVTRREDGTTWQFVPFESHAACLAVAVAGDRVLVASNTGAVALFDPSTGTRLLEVSVGSKYPNLQGLIRHAGRQAVLYTESALFVLDCETLAVLDTFNGMRPRGTGQDFDLVADMPGDGIRPIAIQPIRLPRLVAHTDGTLMASCTIRHDGTQAGPATYGLLSFDLDRKTVLRQLAQEEQSDLFANGFRWFSPSGHHAIRFHFAAIPRHDGRSSWRYADIFSRMLGKGGRTELPDCRLDRVERVGTALEVWQTKPLKPVAKLVVHMQPVDSIWWIGPPGREDVRDLARAMDFAGSNPGDPFPFEQDMRIAHAASNWRIWWQQHLIDIAWEDDEQAFWIFLEQGTVRRVALDGTVSPLFAIDRLRHSRLAKSAGGLGNDARHREHVLSVAGENRLRVNCLGDQIVRLPIPDGAVSGAEMAAVEESFHPGVPLDLPFTKAISDQLGFYTKAFMDLPDLTQASVIGAIDAVRERVATSLPEMVWREGEQYLHLVFVTPTHMIGERAFFDFAAESYPEAAAPALRRLLVTFCQVPPSQPKDAFGFVYTEQESALGHAILALIRLDSDCADVLSLYMSSSNVGQTPFVRDVLLPAFQERNGWKDEAGIRLGIHFATHEAFDGGAGIQHAWEKHGLRDAARRLPAKTVALMILSERKVRGREIDVREVVATWTEVLTDDPFETAVKAELLAHLQPKGADAVAQLHDAIAHIEANSVSEDWTIHMFRSLELDRLGRFNLPARAFGELIVAATQARSESIGFDGRMAARIIRVLRAIAETFDRTQPYDAELLQVLEQACNDVAGRARREG